jgi:hypothetical protein
MLKGGLRDRIAQGLGDEVALPPDPAKLLDDLARALKETADRAMIPRPSPQRGPESLGAPPHVEPTPVMPQILQVRPQRTGGNGRQRRWLGEMLGRLAERTTMGPAVLIAGLATVGFMLLISANEGAAPREKAATGTGLFPIAPITPLPAPALTAAAVHTRESSDLADNVIDQSAGAAATGKEALSTERTMGSSVRIVSAVPQPRRDDKEGRLLADCAAQIQQGNIKTARDALARAASEGSLRAKFALAETFDPNMLAAWGRSERVGDVNTALKLYEQVLARGEARARHRIEALKGDR